MKSRQKLTKTESKINQLVGGKVSQMATYSHLFESTPDAVFLLDPETAKVLEGNPAARAEVVNLDQSFLDLVQTKDRKAMEKLLQGLEKPKAQLVDLQFEGCENIWEVSASLLKLADYCEVIQVIGRNVTEARKSAQALLEANEKLAALSNTDAMTGLFNFRFLRSELEKEHERSQRYKKPYSVILCDIDHFKNFNDTNGHLAGDDCLKNVALLLKNRARNTDLVARYGGEEFLLLCPEVDGAKAEIFARALIETIAKEKMAHGEKQPLGKVTISIGVASFPAHGASPNEIVDAADKALYHSKESGRNRANLFTPEMKTSSKKTKKAS